MFEILALEPGLESLDEDKSTLFASGSNTLSVTFDTDDGDSIFVWASLFARGLRDGVADAFSTMTPAFSDPAGIASQLGAVNPLPVPVAIWLFGAALTGLAVFSKRHKAT